MEIEKRKGDIPIPGNLDGILNVSQRLALPGIELLGWVVSFVRRPLFHEPVLVMHHPINDSNGILDMFGSIKQLGDIKLRKQEGQTQPPPPAKPLIWD